MWIFFQLLPLPPLRFPVPFLFLLPLLLLLLT
jgi:hypothetical protein